MSSHPEQLPHLRAGWHLGPDDGTCLMEHVSQVAGLKFTDTPRCTDPLLAALAQLVNDAVSDRARPQLLSFARPLASRPRAGTGSAPAIVLAVLGPALERRPARRDLRRHQARARRRASQSAAAAAAPTFAPDCSTSCTAGGLLDMPSCRRCVPPPRCNPTRLGTDCSARCSTLR